MKWLPQQPVTVDGKSASKAFLEYLQNLGGPSAPSWGTITGTLSDQTDLNTALNGKQATLVSGTNIKTVNGGSLLGSGDLAVTVTTTEVLNATAGASVGAVGTYAFLAHATANTALTAGTTYAGSALRYFGFVGTLGAGANYAAAFGGTPAGTWRAMGSVGASVGNNGCTLFLRIS